jgi:hypothetical protein
MRNETMSGADNGIQVARLNREPAWKPLPIKVDTNAHYVHTEKDSLVLSAMARKSEPAKTESESFFPGLAQELKDAVADALEWLRGQNMALDAVMSQRRERTKAAQDADTREVQELQELTAKRQGESEIERLNDDRINERAGLQTTEQVVDMSDNRQVR